MQESVDSVSWVPSPWCTWLSWCASSNSKLVKSKKRSLDALGITGTSAAPSSTTYRKVRKTTQTLPEAPTDIHKLQIEDIVVGIGDRIVKVGDHIPVIYTVMTDRDKMIIQNSEQNPMRSTNQFRDCLLIQQVHSSICVLDRGLCSKVSC